MEISFEFRADSLIQHVLNVYSKIVQPELWAQWVRNKTDDFDSGAFKPPGTGTEL